MENVLKILGPIIVEKGENIDGLNVYATPSESYAKAVVEMLRRRGVLCFSAGAYLKLCDTWVLDKLLALETAAKKGVGKEPAMIPRWVLNWEYGWENGIRQRILGFLAGYTT